MIVEVQVGLLCSHQLLLLQQFLVLLFQIEDIKLGVEDFLQGRVPLQRVILEDLDLLPGLAVLNDPEESFSLFLACEGRELVLTLEMVEMIFEEGVHVAVVGDQAPESILLAEVGVVEEVEQAVIAARPLAQTTLGLQA